MYFDLELSWVLVTLIGSLCLSPNSFFLYIVELT
jgi:hypothetical protein